MSEVHHSHSVTVDGLAFEDLRRLKERVDAALDRQREARRQEALESITRLMADAELSPQQVVAYLKPQTARSRRTLPPKYRDPENPGSTWAGRGKKPKWLEEKLAAGARLEDFRIADVGTAAPPAEDNEGGHHQ